MIPEGGIPRITDEETSELVQDANEEKLTGLSSREVEDRVQKGLVNTEDHSGGRTYGQIIRANILTFFNFLNVVLFSLIVWVRSFKNGLFMGVAVLNAGIGIIQEIRAKKILDQLSIVTQKNIVVLRDGEYREIAASSLVQDDVVLLKTGDQVPTDCVVVKGSLEVDESLLTGESVPQIRKEKAGLYSGSFVTSGKALCRVIHTGKDNYSSRITREAKEYKAHSSELRNAVNTILKVVSIVIIPVGILLFYKQYVIRGDTIEHAVVGMVAGVLGMIPEGLVLLTSIALTLGAMTLARKKTLVQELYCIESLARVDTLCLDKTGTLTTGSMKVEEVLVLSGPDKSKDKEIESGDAETEAVQGETDGKAALLEAEEILGNLCVVLKDQNATISALRERFLRENESREVPETVNLISFSSERKYSGAAFKDKGTFLIGAAGFLFPGGYGDLLETCAGYAKEGFRVLVLAHSPHMADKTALPPRLRPGRQEGARRVRR